MLLGYCSVPLLRYPVASLGILRYSSEYLKLNCFLWMEHRYHQLYLKKVKIFGKGGRAHGFE